MDVQLAAMDTKYFVNPWKMRRQLKNVCHEGDAAASRLEALRMGRLMHFSVTYCKFGLN